MVASLGLHQGPIAPPQGQGAPISTEGSAGTPAGLVLGLMRSMARAGVDPAPALREARITPEQLQDPLARLRPGQMETFTVSAMRDMGDEGLGLYSRRLPCGSFEMISRACVSAPNLEIALHRWCRFRRLMIDDLSLTLSFDKDVARLDLHEHRPLVERDLTLLSVLRHVHGLACWFVDSRIALLEVRFPGPGPTFRDAYGSMFPGPVTFGAPIAGLRFARAYLALPVKRDEAATRHMLEQSVSLIVEPYQRDRLLMQRARSLLRQPGDRTWTADRLARALHLSSRRLQRHLAAEGTSFQQLKDLVRRDQAIEWLDRTTWPPKRIATQLGFADEKSFVRAFRRWTGATPTVWRHRARIGERLGRGSMPSGRAVVLD